VAYFIGPPCMLPLHKAKKLDKMTAGHRRTASAPIA